MSKENWEEKMKALLKPLEESLGSLSSSLTFHLEEHQKNPPSPRGEKGEGEVPTHKCKGKNCTYATEDINDFVEHKIREMQPQAEAAKEEEPEKRRHETVEDFLNCPECFQRFERGFLARGYEKKTPEKKPEGGLAI